MEQKGSRGQRDNHKHMVERVRSVGTYQLGRECRRREERRWV